MLSITFHILRAKSTSNEGVVVSFIDRRSVGYSVGGLVGLCGTLRLGDCPLRYPGLLGLVLDSSPGFIISMLGSGIRGRLDRGSGDSLRVMSFARRRRRVFRVVRSGRRRLTVRLCIRLLRVVVGGAHFSVPKRRVVNSFRFSDFREMRKRYFYRGFSGTLMGGLVSSFLGGVSADRAQHCLRRFYYGGCRTFLFVTLCMCARCPRGFCGSVCGVVIYHSILSGTPY